MSCFKYLSFDIFKWCGVQDYTRNFIYKDMIIIQPYSQLGASLMRLMADYEEERILLSYFMGYLV